jgi:16S rRNA (adenine1518-N6/adenine1519-N6)-dimethyltransferase
MEEHGIHPSRALGQNFVVDPNTVDRVARLAEVGPGDRVIEVGAGLGSLTLALCDTGARVTAMEVDPRLIHVLGKVAAPAGAELVHADARTVDWARLLGGERWVLVANLPYNIATPLVADLLDNVPAIERMLVMVQSEVGDRLAAAPGSDAYGAVSVKVRYWATAAVVGRVPPTVFIPKPKVDSALVRIDRRPDGPLIDRSVVSADRLFEVVRAGFGHRRKMLRGALRGVVPAHAFEAAGVSETARAEELDVDDFARLAAVRS